jgi:hypothetical protein
MSDREIEFEEMVIGRALDALDTEGTGAGAPTTDTATEVAVREYQEVLSHLQFDEIEPPTALEDRVFAAAREVRPPAVPSISRRRRTARLVVLASAAAVAAIVALILIAGHSSTTNTNPQAHLIRTVDPAVVHQLVDAPNSQKTDLVGDSGTVGHVVFVNGQGALYDTALPPAANTTYWFWVSGNNTTARVGPIAVPRGGGLLFEVRGNMTGALITAETEGSIPTTPGHVVGQGQFPG